MNDGFQFLDIILLAMVAGFILLRLRNILGRRIGHHQEMKPPITSTDSSGEKEARTGLQHSSSKETGIGGGPSLDVAEPAEAGLENIRLVDRNFDPIDFLQGATGAYELIVAAFADGDLEVLRSLLNGDVFSSFEEEIKNRIDRGEKQDTKIDRFLSVTLMRAELHEKKAEITVRFITSVIEVIRKADGTILSGDPDLAEEVTDLWTFSRNVTSQDPNWLLIETATVS